MNSLWLSKREGKWLFLWSSLLGNYFILVQYLWCPCPWCSRRSRCWLVNSVLTSLEWNRVKPFHSLIRDITVHPHRLSVNTYITVRCAVNSSCLLVLLPLHCWKEWWVKHNKSWLMCKNSLLPVFIGLHTHTRASCFMLRGVSTYLYTADVFCLSSWLSTSYRSPCKLPITYLFHIG